MTTFDIAYMHPGSVHTHFADALVETIRVYPEAKALPVSGKRLVLSKNVASKWWLKNSTADWLLWADADVAWAPEDLQRLLDTAEEKGPSIVSGLGFHWMDDQVYPGFFVDRVDNRLLACTAKYVSFPRDEPFEVPGCGGMFMLIHRNIFKDMLKEEHIEGYPFFFAQWENGKAHGYSQHFNKLAVDLGYKVWIEPRCEVKHYEYVPLSSQIYDRWWDQ